jgi:hypothetical protein
MDCAEYKYYEYRVAQEEAALAPEAGGSAAPYTGWTGSIYVFPKKLHFGVMEHCFCYKLLKDQDLVIAGSLLITWCSYQAPFCWSGSGVYEVMCVPKHWHSHFSGSGSNAPRYQSSHSRQSSGGQNQRYQTPASALYSGGEDHRRPAYSSGSSQEPAVGMKTVNCEIDMYSCFLPLLVFIKVFDHGQKKRAKLYHHF